MNWDVYWAPVAENELATLWLNPAMRQLVTVASQRIDERLAFNGIEEGESRPGVYRITFEAPLGVLFHVDESTRRVTVVHVWAFET